MIIRLSRTTTAEVQRRMLEIRDEGGVVALGRVLTLVVHTQIGAEEEAIRAANAASREHPMRVIVVSRNPDRVSAKEEPRLDAELRVAGRDDLFASGLHVHDHERPLGPVRRSCERDFRARRVPERPGHRRLLVGQLLAAACERVTDDQLRLVRAFLVREPGQLFAVGR